MNIAMRKMKFLFSALAATAACAAFAADFDIRDFGARTDAPSNTRAINAAVKAAAEKGGRVVVPAGRWTTGSIELKSGVELHLAKGAVLLGSLDKREYNANDAFPENVWSVAEEWSGAHLVWARLADGIAVTGEGVIDGNGPGFFGDCDFVSFWPWYKYGIKLHPTDREWFRPGMMLAFFRCKNIRLSGVTLANTTSWSCHLRCCENVDIRGITVEADRTIANSDGFSIDCTRNVNVEKCVLRTGDDGFAIRASCGRHATTNFCENIVIRDCDISSCCYAIRFGIGTGTIRNVKVLDSRVHEAAGAAFGFTPAWVNEKRNCYIQDIEISNCTVTDCVAPVDVAQTKGDYRVSGIKFSKCVFNTLLPGSIHGRKEVGFEFTDCTRNTIDRFKVRHKMGWNERGIRNGRCVFIDVTGDKSAVKITRCNPEPLENSGVLLLSFDDRNFDGWLKALPVFRKYGAHATFFIDGEFTQREISACKRLMAEGHSIGLHGRTHANVPEYVKKHGADAYFADEIDKPKRQANVAFIPTGDFAYPNCRRTDETDKLLLGRFDRLRGGLGKIRPYDPKGLKRANLKPLVTDDRVFFPVKELASRRVVNSLLIGEFYNTDIDDVVACVKRAGERKEVLVLASHKIEPGAGRINMKTEWLEKILAAAKEHGVKVLSFRDIPLK